MKRLLVDCHRAGIGDLICLSSTLSMLSAAWEITAVGKEKNLGVLRLFGCVSDFAIRGSYDWTVRLSLPGGGNGLQRSHLIDAFAVQFGLAGRVLRPSVKRLLRARDLGEKTVIAVATDSGRPNKTWAHANFAQVAEELADRFTVVQIGGGERLAAAGIDARGHMDFIELAEWLFSADLFFGCDSGLAHLAAAVGTPSVVVYGATDPRHYTYPSQTPVFNLGGCHGCFNRLDRADKAMLRGCPLGKDLECLTRLHADAVAGLVAEKALAMRREGVHARHDEG